MFDWLWLVADADLLWENSIADWLVAGADLIWENSTAGWLADKPSEHSDNCHGSTNLPRVKILVYLGGCLVFIKIFIIWMLDARGQFQTYLSSLFILDWLLSCIQFLQCVGSSGLYRKRNILTVGSSVSTNTIYFVPGQFWVMWLCLTLVI